MTIEELNAKYGKPTTPTALNAPTKRSSLADIVAKQKKPDMLSKVKDSFIARDLAGVTQEGEDDTLPEKIYQNTLGSKGISGVAQAPVRPIVTAIGARNMEEVEKNRKTMIDSADKWLERAKSEVDPVKKKEYVGMATQTLRESEELVKTREEINKVTPKSESNLKDIERVGGQALNTITTLAPFASAAGTAILKPVQAALHSKTIVNEGIKTAIKTGGARAATTAVQGAAVGLGQSMAAEKSAGDVAKDTIISGIIGGGLSIANSVAKYGIHKVADSMAQSFVNSAIGPTKNAKIKDQILTQAKQELGKTNKQTLAQKFLANGKIGTNKGLIKSSIEITNDVGDKMDDVLKGSTGKTPISMSGVAEKFDDLINQTKSVLGDKAAAPLEALKKTYTSKGQSITAKEATQLYRAIYKLLPDKAWSVSNPSLVPAKEALRNVAGTLSDRVTKAVPAMKPLNFTFGMWKEVESNLLTREASKGLIKPLTEKIAAAAIIPTTIANPVAGASLAAGLGVEKALTSAPVKLSAGFLLEKIANANLPQQVTEALKQLILRGVSEGNQNTTEQDQK